MNGDVAALDVFGRFWFEIKEFSLLADGELAIQRWRDWSVDDWFCCKDFFWKQ